MNLPARNLAAPDGRHQPAARGEHAASGSATVSVASLSKRYGAVTAVADLTFSLYPGTVTGFLGPNGAGKSTTLRMLVGLAEPAAGQALVLGRRYQDLDHPAPPWLAGQDPGQEIAQLIHSLRPAPRRCSARPRQPWSRPGRDRPRPR